MKKGQVSIFIIISTIILVSTIFLIDNNSSNKLKLIESDKNLNSIESDATTRVKSYIDSCLKQQSEFAIDISLYNNGEYISGDYDKIPNFPTLFTYDLWMHTSSSHSLSLENYKTSLKTYLNDTLKFCIDDFETLENIKITTNISQLDFNIKINSEDILFNLFLPVEIVDENSKTYTLKLFSYKSKNVPIRQIIEDSNKIVSIYQNLVTEIDGKTNGIDKMQWGDVDSAISKIPTSEKTNRNDMKMFVNKFENQVDIVLNYKEQYRETYYMFSIISNTNQSIQECKYCNNVVNTFHGTGETQ